MRTGLALYRALRSVDVPDDKAMAVIEALETEMQARLAKAEPEYQALRSVYVPDDKVMAGIEARETEMQARLAKAEPGKLRYSIKDDSDRFVRSFTINLFLMLTSFVVIVLSAFYCMH